MEPHSDMYPIVQKRIADEIEKIITHQVTPWVFLKTTAGLNVKKFDGKEIRYGGIEFSGSARDVFWGRYIEPFLEHAASATIEYVIGMCSETHSKLEPALVDTYKLLTAGVRAVYEEMVDVDRRLRGAGEPDKVRPQNIEHLVHGMEQFIENRIAAEIKMRSRSPVTAWLQRWYKRNQVLVWIIGILATLLSAISPWL